MFDLVRACAATAAALALSLAFGACSNAPPEKPQPSLAFTAKSPLVWPVGQVEFIDAYKPPLAPPNVEQDHEVRPTHLVRTWINERLERNASLDGKLTITVTEASVVSQKLEVPTGWRSSLTRDPAETLKGRLAWRLSYVGPNINWATDAFAQSERTIPEQASLNERDAAYANLIEGLGRSLDERLEDQLTSLQSAIAASKAP